MELWENGGEVSKTCDWDHLGLHPVGVSTDPLYPLSSKDDDPLFYPFRPSTSHHTLHRPSTDVHVDWVETSMGSGNLLRRKVLHKPA